MPKEKLKPLRWWDWSSAILLLLILQIAATRLVATKWTDDLSLIPIVTLIGTLLGLALGQSIFSRKIVLLFTVAYAVCIIPWQLGLTMEAGIGWVERLLSLWGRLVVVAQELVQGETITDNILFLLLMAVVFWCVAIYTGFTLDRNAHTWRVVLPSGLATFIIHTFDPLLASRSWYLAFNLFFSLLLVARLVYIKNRAIWKQRRVHVPPDASFDLSRITVVVALIVVLFAWNVPVMADTLGPVANVWRTATNPLVNLHDRFSYAFASLKASVGLVTDIYGERLPLGLGTPLSDEVVMEVEALRDPPQNVRYYWRAMVYGVFENDEWRTGLSDIDERQLLPSGTNLNQPGVDTRTEAFFTFFPSNAISMLYVAPQPIWISRPSTAILKSNPDGTIDLESVSAQAYLKGGEQYEVRSSLSAVTLKNLREAGTDYPQWVMERYLQLPDDISTRTYELAQELAQGQDTPYDVAAAVTNYLRENITYQLTIEAPPARANRIDWFLFEYKQGFCYYYATSEVILLRSLGIPARIAVGFAQGERQAEAIGSQQGGEVGPFPEMADNARYVVRRNDAHAWPEVFFPGIGWVEFEPTTGQDPIYRPSGEDFSNADVQNLRPFEPPPLDDQIFPEDRPPDSTLPLDATGAQSNSWIIGAIIRYIVLLLAFGLFIWVISKPRRRKNFRLWFDKASQQTAVQLEKGLGHLGIKTPSFIRDWAFMAGLQPLNRAYLEINRSLHRLGRSPQIQDTPAERAAALIEVLPIARWPIDTLLDEYQAATYSLHSADVEVAWQASTKIRKFSYQELIKRFQDRFYRFIRKRL
jgi:transglutaminase-like putative cysteine protease